MNDNELNLLAQLSHLKTTVNLFLIAFEEQEVPMDVVNAFYILEKQVSDLESCVKIVSSNLIIQNY